MNSVMARAVVAKVGAADAAAKVVADAPVLSDAQLEALRGLLLQNTTTAAPTKATVVNTDHEDSSRDLPVR
jgi:hypothetical protein